MNSVRINSVEVSGDSVQRLEGGYIIILRTGITRKGKHVLVMKNDGSEEIVVRTVRTTRTQQVTEVIIPVGESRPVELSVTTVRDVRIGSEYVQFMHGKGAAGKQDRVSSFLQYHGSPVDGIAG